MLLICLPAGERSRWAGLLIAGVGGLAYGVVDPVAGYTVYEGYITEEKVNSSKCTIHTCGAEARQGCVRVPWSAMRAHAAAAHAGRRSRALRARAIPSRMLRAPFITIALEIRCA